MSQNFIDEPARRSFVNEFPVETLLSVFLLEVETLSVL
jgi:hypothetical protein